MGRPAKPKAILPTIVRDDVAKETGKTKAQVEEEFFDSLQPEVGTTDLRGANVETPPAGTKAEGEVLAPGGELDRFDSSSSQTPTPSAVSTKKKAKGRIAGNEGSYSFALCRVGEDDDGNRILTPTEHGFSLPSVTTLIGDVLGKPGNAMAYWGFYMGLDAGIVLSREVELAELTRDQLHDLAKKANMTPTRQRDDAGDRGSKAHDVLEQIAKDNLKVVGTPGSYGVVDAATGEAVALDEYAKGGVEWWMAEHWTTEWDTVAVEVPVWSLDHGFSGTFDLLRGKQKWSESGYQFFEIVDYKTHKPARTHKPIRPGEGVGYISDIVQLRFYRMALEEMSRQPWCPEWLPRNIRITSQRVVLFTAEGGYAEDTREVSEEAAIGIVRVAQALREVG